MNMVSLLIGATAVLLLAVFALSFGSMKKDVSSQASEKELLRQELALLNQMASSGTPEREKETSLKDEELSQMKAELEALKAERLAAQAALEEATPEPEPQIAADDERRLERRAKLIGAAMVMAQIQEYLPDDGFASISIINYENVQEGVVLAIRRNTGIIGQLKVSTVEGGEAIADALPYTFLSGTVDVQPGDELILPPL